MDTITDNTSGGAHHSTNDLHVMEALAAKDAEIKRLCAALEELLQEQDPGDEVDRWKRHIYARQKARKIVSAYQQSTKTEKP